MTVNPSFKLTVPLGLYPNKLYISFHSIVPGETILYWPSNEESVFYEPRLPGITTKVVVTNTYDDEKEQQVFESRPLGSIDTKYYDKIYIYCSLIIWDRRFSSKPKLSINMNIDQIPNPILIDDKWQFNNNSKTLLLNMPYSPPDNYYYVFE